MEDLIILNSDIKDDAIIDIGGYKHVFVSIISAVIAKNISAKLYNVPDISDTYQIINILESIGKKVEFKNTTMYIQKGNIIKPNINEILSGSIHGSIYLFVAIVIANKKGSMFASGGCAIGTDNTKSTRPENHTLDIMNKFGININLTSKGEKIGFYNKLKENVTIDINDCESENLRSGATKTALICSLGLNHGFVKIKNPYLKPDVVELVSFLKKIGYEITITDKIIEIKTEATTILETSFKIMPDISEIISFIGFGIYNNINLNLHFDEIQKVKDGLHWEFYYLEKCNAPIAWNDKGIKIIKQKRNKISNFNITVDSTTIFSDSQPFFALIALKACGDSYITEKVWTSRFQYAQEARKLNIPFEIKGNTLIVHPLKNIENASANELIANDLRAAFALLTLASGLDNAITIRNFHHIHRGYAKIYDKLRGLGLNIKVIKKESYEVK